MAITLEDYLRKAHVYMESESGRKEAFHLFKKEMDTALRTDNISLAMSTFRYLKGYLKGDSFLFMNFDRPNTMALREQKKNIKVDALHFLKENLDLIKQVYVRTPYSRDKFQVMFVLIKFLPEIRHLPLVHYVDLYLLLFYTVYYLDTFSGDEEDKANLGDIIVKAFCRYDCMALGKKFIRDSELSRVAKNYSIKFEPYKSYVNALKEALEKEYHLKETSGIFDESVLAPLLFTQNFIGSYDGRIGDFIRKNLDKKRKKIFSSVFSRFHRLFQRSKIGSDIIKDVMEIYFDQQIDRLKKSSSKRPYPVQPSPFDPGPQMKRL
jgi:hypothetical protein